jgi:hypothetical protein
MFYITWLNINFTITDLLLTKIKALQSKGHKILRVDG